jgi:hypothetical protein
VKELDKPNGGCWNVVHWRLRGGKYRDCASLTSECLLSSGFGKYLSVEIVALKYEHGAACQGERARDFGGRLPVMRNTTWDILSGIVT